MFDLSGKNVVLVGGFGGIGLQVSRILLKKKVANLVIVSRMENVEMLSKLQKESTDTKVTFVHMNLIDRASIENAIKKIVSMVKHIDVLVNGGGVVADKDVETTIGVNLTGLIQTTLMAMPHMSKEQQGHGGVVVNIASVWGLEPSPVMAVYSAAKHGVIGWTRSLASEHLHQKTGVSVISVCPGLTSTELMVNLRDNATMNHSTPLVDLIANGKYQTPEQVANHVVMAVETMKNGAIYISNHGDMQEIVPTVHWTL